MTEPVPDTSTRAQRPVNLALALAIVVALVGTTWFMGEHFGWADIGTGGQNEQLLPRIGEEAPEFFTLREDGQPMLLSQYRGQPVWLNFWGSWCAPCRAEMPEFISAYQQLTEQGIVILAISTNEAPQQAIQYRDLVGGNFPVYIDPSFINAFIDADENPDLADRFASMRSDWEIRNYPTHVFIDADGIVRQIVIAQMNEDEMIETSLSLLEPRSLLPEVVVWRIE